MTLSGHLVYKDQSATDTISNWTVIQDKQQQTTVVKHVGWAVALFMKLTGSMNILATLRMCSRVYPCYIVSFKVTKFF